jgi:hypothetical protein
MDTSSPMARTAWRFWDAAADIGSALCLGELSTNTRLG